MPPLFELARRLEEHGQKADLRPTRAGQSFGVGPFEVEPLRVNHSIPDATGLILRTPAGVVVHSGDFKIERDPVDNLAFDAERLRRAGDAGVRLLLSDSTRRQIRSFMLARIWSVTPLGRCEASNKLMPWARPTRVMLSSSIL